MSLFLCNISAHFLSADSEILFWYCSVMLTIVQMLLQYKHSAVCMLLFCYVNKSTNVNWVQTQCCSFDYKQFCMCVIVLSCKIRMQMFVVVQHRILTINLEITRYYIFQLHVCIRDRINEIRPKVIECKQRE